MEPIELSGIMFCFAGIGVGAIDEHDIMEHGRVDSDDVDRVGGQSERFEVEVGGGDDLGPAGGGPFAAGGCDLSLIHI